MRSLVIALTAAVAVAGSAAEQASVPVTGNAQSAAPPTTVAAAEGEGAKWPRNPPRAERTDQTWADAFGPRERQCVRAADHVSIRSGDFVIGPFKERFMMVGTRGEPARWKIWWIPNQMPPLDGSVLLTLRAGKMDNPEKTVTRTFTEIANARTDTPFFPTTILFPEKGDWLVVATAGNNWGCFIIDETHPG